MPDVHLLQWTVAFAAALWLTARWLLSRPRSRWRHLVGGAAATILWIPVAYTANNVYVATDGGSTVRFGSEALGTVATFMAVVCIIGLLIGLVLWTEEHVDEAHDDLPAEMQHDRQRGD
jgi:uncharacterized BrkB/YihY/UPF0761 family membrane protein